MDIPSDRYLQYFYHQKVGIMLGLHIIKHHMTMHMMLHHYSPYYQEP